MWEAHPFSSEKLSMPKSSRANMTTRTILSGCTFSARNSTRFVSIPERGPAAYATYPQGCRRRGVRRRAATGPDTCLKNSSPAKSWETRAREKGDGAGARRPRGLNAAVGKGLLSRTKTLKSEVGARCPERTLRTAATSPYQTARIGAGVGTSAWRPGRFRRCRDDFPANRPYGEQTTPYGSGAREC